MKMLSAFSAVLVVACYAAGASTDAVAAAGEESTSQIIREHAPPGITEAFYQCIDKADPSTIGSAACLTAEQERQDKRLNANYKALLAKLSPEAKKELVLAERAWLKFQDANGALESSVYGSEIIDNLQVTQNEIFRICERANALDDYLFVARLQ